MHRLERGLTEKLALPDIDIDKVGVGVGGGYIDEDDEDNHREKWENDIESEYKWDLSLGLSSIDAGRERIAGDLRLAKSIFLAEQRDMSLNQLV